MMMRKVGGLRWANKLEAEPITCLGNRAANAQDLQPSMLLSTSSIISFFHIAWHPFKRVTCAYMPIAEGTWAATPFS